MISKGIIALAEGAQYDAVAFELRQAKARAKARHFTESVMRLGRATEASLYAAAREFGINIQLHIPVLSSVYDNIKGVEAKILLHRSTNDVKKLTDISRTLANATIDLAVDELTRNGCEGSIPRGNNSILTELIAAIDDKRSKRRLGEVQGLLQKIMSERNSGAHACPKGNMRETDPAVYPDLVREFEEFITTIIEVAVGQRSRSAVLVETDDYEIQNLQGTVW